MQLKQPTRDQCRTSLSLLGLAPGGVYLALSITVQAVVSYTAVSPLPVGGLFSAALSVALLLLAVSQHHRPVEPGLSSVTRDYLRNLNYTIRNPRNRHPCPWIHRKNHYPERFPYESSWILCLWTQAARRCNSSRFQDQVLHTI